MIFRFELVRPKILIFRGQAKKNSDCFCGLIFSNEAQQYVS